MRPEYEKIDGQLRRSFAVRRIQRENRTLLSKAWHYHPEVEICYTMKSRGRRFVGNQISEYYQGDIVLLGSNLPHGFTTDMRTDQIVVQMKPDFLGRDFLLKPELRNIQSLLENAKRGIYFPQSISTKLGGLIRRLSRAEGFDKLILLLDILNKMSEESEFEYICSAEYARNYDPDHFDQLKSFYRFISKNYRKNLYARDIAAHMNLTEVGFYRYIKRHTSKTFTEILNEVRISESCKLLVDTELSIAEVCFQCGFNNISYFNRKFKTKLGVTPKVFRNQYLDSPIPVG